MERLTADAHKPVTCCWCVTYKGSFGSSTKSESSPRFRVTVKLVNKADWLKPLNGFGFSRVRSLQPLVTATQLRIGELEVKLSPLSSELLQLVQSGE